MDAPFPVDVPLPLGLRVALQLLSSPTSRDNLRTVLDLSAASDLAQLDSILDWFEQQDLITAASADPMLRHHLTDMGRNRARMSAKLGARAVSGLDPNQTTVLRILQRARLTHGRPVNFQAEFGRFIGRDMEPFAQGLAREGFAGDSVQRFNPGSQQPAQWYITDDGLELLACLGILPIEV